MVRIKQPLNLLTYAAAFLGVAPLYAFLDLPVQAVLPVALAGSAYFDRRGSSLLKPLPATLLSLACLVFYGAQLSRDNLVVPAVNILALLLAVRLLTEKTGRNYLQIFVLALFALAGSSLLSLSPLFLLDLVLLVAAVTTGLVLLTFHTADPRMAIDRRQLKQILCTALVLPAASLLLMVFFFFILPRTRQPLWNFLNPGGIARSGVGDQVSPGSFAGIAASRDVAFRVECEKLDPRDLYWRGVVLDALEGDAWVRAAAPGEEDGRPVGGRQARQTIYIEPRQDRRLFALDPPLHLEGIRARRTGDGVFAASRLEQRRKYEAVSLVGGYLQPKGRVDRDFYLRVPPGVSARVRAVAERTAARGRNAEDKIALLEDFFRGQGLIFATEDLPGAENPIDQFLFVKKRGYCEYFASSFAVLLRLAGVPARLVGGYYGGEYNDLGGYYVVTEAAAHVWVEALVAGHWVKIDPSRLAGNADHSPLVARSRELGTFRRMVDAADYFWNRAVIAYDFQSQIRALQQADSSLKRWTTGLSWRTVLLWGLLLVGAAGLAWTVRHPRRSREGKLVEKYLRQVKKCYGPGSVGRQVGLRELAESLDDPRCKEFAEIYGGAIYRDRKPDRNEVRRLRQLIREIGREPGSDKRGCGFPETDEKQVIAPQRGKTRKGNLEK
jgi:transglutaminase-like putative cysteine protease